MVFEVATYFLPTVCFAVKVYVLGDSAFAACLVLCARSDTPTKVRLWQYAAAACTVLAFGLPSAPVGNQGQPQKP